MKNDIKNLLKVSLEHERNSVKKKISDDVNDRFEKADILFGNNHTHNLEHKKNIIRDTFTLPKNDYELIGLCKTKLLEHRINATKSEIIRAGLVVLSSLTDQELLSAHKLLDKIKVGRPKQRTKKKF